MTKKIKVGLIIALAAVCASCTIAGCKVGSATREDILASYTGACVTYYGNGGYFNDSTTITVREIYYQADGVPFFDIKEKGNETKEFIDHGGYNLLGWYKVETYGEGDHSGEEMFTYEGEAVYKIKATNEDGSVKTDKKGNVVYVVDDSNRPMYATAGNMGNSSKYVSESNITPVLSDVKLTESDLLKSGSKISVGAKWKETQRIEYVLVSDVAMTDKDGNTYQSGDVLDDAHQFGTGETVQPMTIKPLDSSNCTWLANYLDEACTVPVTSNTVINRPAEGNAKIYSKYIKGVWTIVSTPADVAAMFNNTVAGSNFYVLNDIVCDGQNANFKSNGVSGTIEGNNHTISNLNLITPRTGNLSIAQNGSVNSLFGEIKSGSYIKNITFENVTVNLSTSSRYSVELYGVYSKLEQGAEFGNVAIRGLTLKVAATGAADALDVISNYKAGEKEDGWLFGGESGDAAFLAAHTDVTVTGASITAA